MSQTPEELARKIREARAKEEASQPPAKNPAAAKDGTATGQALRAATDLVAALLVGGFLGYWLDRWLNTKPLFMIVMFFLGFAAGFLNIYRSQTGQDLKIGFKKDKKENGE